MMRLANAASSEAGPNLHALGVLDNAKAPASKDEPKDIFELITKLGDYFIGMANVLKVIPMNIRNLGEVGLAGILDPTKVSLVSQNPINAGFQSLEPRGGVAASLGVRVANLSDVIPRTSLPEVHPMTYNSGVEVSPAILGNISPQQFEGLGRSSELGMGLA